MGDDIAVRRLVEILSACFTEKKAAEEDLACSLTSEFLANMQAVVFNKQLFALLRWESYLDAYAKRMLRSPEMYLQYVFFACLLDATSNFNIFERFLSAYAFILCTCLRTYSIYEVNFCRLIPDIFMVFYEKELKKPFGKCKGIHRFVQFINDPKYLESECRFGYTTNPYIDDSKVTKGSEKKACERIKRTRKLPADFNFMRAEVDPDSSSLAKKVLAITRTEFIPSMIVLDAKVSLSDFVKQKAAQAVKMIKGENVEKGEISEATFNRCPSLNFDPKIKDDTPEQIMDNARCENVFEAVRRYNHLESSCRVKSKDRHPEGVILDHLKWKIQFLIEVLDKI